ncbi:MAG TPA: NUDIX domain-containing protein [Candidatus Rifleibacterium sp.]|nr:NUDIX domain-containing protein [Candidatus Rifleibacterium sp.]HPT47778.1 NUDIX domain-containing protein [Candidatus Rifleibacterium sp.]
MQQPETVNNQIRIRVTVLVKREDGKICFVRHLKNGRRYWLLPGGGQDIFETAESAAGRELYEELRMRVGSFRLLFVRESMNPAAGRHIQFLVFEGLQPDFSSIATGEDERVEGYDFFGPDEIAGREIFPAMKEDIIRFARGQTIEMFKALEWIP